MHEVMGWESILTHRQFEAWQEWLLLEANVTSKLDAYLMQIAQEVRRVLHKKPNAVKLDEFKIKFSVDGENEKKKPTKEELEMLSNVGLQMFMSGLGLDKNKIRVVYEHELPNLNKK